MKHPPYFKTSVRKLLKLPISTQCLEFMLSLVSVEICRTVLNRWTKKQRAIVEDWAMRVHLSASDNPVRVPQRPGYVATGEHATKGKWYPCKDKDCLACIVESREIDEMLASRIGVYESTVLNGGGR